ncbi:MAG: long-chain fatty acid--CoA ligase [Thermodesulfobacteriota bacterium]
MNKQKEQPETHDYQDIISAAEAATLPGLFQCRARRSPQAIAYRQYEPATGDWQSHTWLQMQEKIDRWRTALAAEGVSPGDRVALYLRNSVEWVCCEQAALSLGLVAVPLYCLDTAQNIAFILGNSGTKILLVGDLEQWLALAPYQADLPDLQLVLFLAGNGDSSEGSRARVRRVADWLPDSAGSLPDQAGDPHALATLIYTSGTTGPPKGVMLSHANILCNGEAILKVVSAFPSDIFLSFLPLSHAFERTVGYYVPMIAGAQVVFARSVKDLGEDLLMVRPTVLISVPRIYERVYGRIYEKTKSKGRFAAKLLTMTVETGWRIFEAGQGRAAPPAFSRRLLWPLLQRLVAQKVLDRLGGRVRLAVTGGAPLHEKVARLFIGLGLPLLQGYGLTESSPVVSANTLADNFPASVGRPLPGVEMEVGPAGELLVRSPSVMLGYWKDPDRTREMLTTAGWLHTGDVVQLRDGRIFIRGRLKEILVTSTGEKIAPTDLEMAITESPLFYQAMVVGEGKPYLAALLVMDRQGWQELAGRLALDPADPATLKSRAVTDAVLAKLTEILGAFPAYARVRAVCLMLDSWTYEDGLVTTLMKLRRHEIEKRFAGEIAALYAGHHLPE